MTIAEAIHFHRRTIPPELVWVSLLIGAIWLTAPPDGSMLPASDAAFWLNVLPGLGIVATLAPLAGQRAGRARALFGAMFGVIPLIAILGQAVPAFHVVDEGYLHFVFAVTRNEMGIGITAFALALSDMPTLRDIFTSRVIFILGCAVFLAIGFVAAS